MPRRQFGGLSTFSESGDSQRDPFADPTEYNDFYVPSPRSGSEEEPSPSQYQAEKMQEDAADENEDEEPLDLTSESEDDEASPPVKHTKYSPPKIHQPSSTDGVYSKFLNMGLQFVGRTLASKS